MTKTKVFRKKQLIPKPAYTCKRSDMVQGVGFRPGNPGKPVGAVSRTTMLKNKLLDFSLKQDFDQTEMREKITYDGKVLRRKIRTFPKLAMVRLAASLLPKEMAIKAEGMSATFQNIVVNKTLKDEEVVNDINARFMQQFSKEKKPELTVSEDS